MDRNINDEANRRIQHKRKKLYGSYLPEQSIPVSRTTLWRRRKLARQSEVEVYQSDPESTDSEASNDAPQHDVHADESENSRLSVESLTSENPGQEPYVEENDNPFDSSSVESDSDSVNSVANESDSADSNAPPQIDSTFNVHANQNVTLGDLLFMVYSFSVRHSLTQLATKDLLQMLNVILGEDTLPSSIYLFQKTFLKYSPQQTYHIFCSNCDNYLLPFNRNSKTILEGNCPSCNDKYSTAKLNNNSFFVTISLREQLELKLNDSEFQDLLNLSRNKDSRNFTAKDRLSGSVYKKGSIGEFLQNKNNLSLTVNTDGAKKHKSAHQSAWPIFITVDQIPCECQNPVLVGLWYGRSAPNMHTFFKPITAELNSLHEVGILWGYGTEKNVTTKFVVSCFTSDIPARAKVLNFIGHMGQFSCLFCTNPGILVDVGKGARTCKQIRYPETEKTFELRTNEQFFDDIEIAVLRGEAVRGIKGSNPLLELHLFRIPYNIAIDMLHNVCKGEMEAFINAVTSSVGKPYYIGAPKTIQVITKRLSSIKPVSCIARLARPLEDRHFFSAKEWLHFLLFFGPISLQGILQQTYLKMFCEFSEAVYLLISDNMTSADIDSAEELILKYVIDCSLKFGYKYCVSNNHLLLHLADDVRKFGSLLNHSTFEFESANGWLLKFIKSSKGVIQQAVKNYLLNVNLHFFLSSNNIKISPKVKNYTQSLIPGRRRQYAHCSKNVTVLGKGVLGQLPIQINQLIPLEFRDSDCYLVFERMVVDGYVYCTRNYSSKQLHDDSCIGTSNNEYYQIDTIFRFPDRDEIFISCNRLYTENECNSLPKHIQKLNVFDPVLSVFELNFTITKILLLECSGISYISKLPSTKMID